MPAIKTVKTPVPPKKNAQRIPAKPQKTILIKNQLGQTVSVFNLNRVYLGSKLSINHHPGKLVRHNYLIIRLRYTFLF